jgi:hypothetical protein
MRFSDLRELLFCSFRVLVAVAKEDQAALNETFARVEAVHARIEARKVKNSQS